MTDDRGGAQRRNALEIIGKMIDGIVAQVCVRHYDADTQEHQLTSKTAHAIETGLNGIHINGYTVGIAAQDLSDKGKGSKERKVGADLYISVVLYGDEKPISKGMLVQAKWDDTFSPGATDMGTQLRHMLARTRAAHVWVYEPAEVISIPAIDVMKEEAHKNATTAGQLVANGLGCIEGDPQIGRDTSKELIRSLNDMLEELAADVAIDVTVRPQR
jgi:hypothetical protein